MSGERFNHNTVVVLGAFAESVLALHEAIETAVWGNGLTRDFTWWDERVAKLTVSAVRAARMLTVREEYR